MSRKWTRLFPLVLLLCLSVALPTQRAQAADYPVGCDADNATRVNELITAISNTNGNVDSDTITLTADCVYTLTAPNNTYDDRGPSGLPAVVGTLTINGNGATIERSSAGGTPDFRLMIVGYGGNLTLNDVILQNGDATGSYGGGAVFSLGTLAINNSTISNNTAANTGGGVSGSYVTVNNSTFSGNTSGNGGAMYTVNVVTITDSTFSGNVSGGSGGALYMGGSVTISGTTFSNNSSEIAGGALYFWTGGLNLTNSTFSGNSARDGGGAAVESAANISRTTFSNNTASNIGGGLFFEGYNLSGGSAYPLNLNNSTFSGNQAGSGGGMYVGEGVTVKNSTFSGNSANEGGGFTNIWAINMYNTIVANSAGGGECQRDQALNGNYNLFESACSGFGADNLLNTVTADPLLGVLTGSPAYFPLLNGSPAIDAGNNDEASAFAIDHAGNPRFYDDTGVADTGSGTAPIVDIGAVEKQTNTVLPAISISNVTLTEGNSGTKAFNFTVLLNAASPQTVTVDYATANGSADAASDYTSANGTLTFNPSETSKQITVLVNGDLTHELHENFMVNLSNPTNATIADNQGVGQINNDDGRPTIRVNDIARTEGGSGTQTNLPFTVTLSNPSYQTITVQFATSNGSATIADGDYTPFGLTTLSFAPGMTSRNVTVKINGDAKHEPHETLNFTLTNPTNATIADSLGVGTIANDDSRPTISVNDVSRAEGNSGTTNFPFVVTLSHPSYQTITVNFATSDVTATAGTDYTARSGSLSFAPGVTSRNITVVGNGDTTFEPNETFNFTLNTPLNATIADSLGVGTITNDDAAGLSEEGVQIVPVAPELPQFLPVAPVMPDAPVQPSQPTEAVPLMPAGGATGNPVMFMWRAATGASSYNLQITSEAGELVYEGVFSAAVDCAGEICQALPDVALTSGVNYLWSIQADSQPRSFGMLFVYTDTTFSPIVNP